jgi:hypothetical protein
MNMPTVGPEFRKVESSRIRISIELVPAWAKGEGTKSLSLRMVPLIWKRSLLLPTTSALDAWYLWSPDNDVGNWTLNPKHVLDRVQFSDADQKRLGCNIWEASIVMQNRAHCLSCARLFTSLALKSAAGCLWIAQEESESLSVWTDPAYQLHFGKMDDDS